MSIVYVVYISLLIQYATPSRKREVLASCHAHGCGLMLVDVGGLRYVPLDP